jgi:hypothetical protein
MGTERGPAHLHLPAWAHRSHGTAGQSRTSRSATVSTSARTASTEDPAQLYLTHASHTTHNFRTHGKRWPAKSARARHFRTAHDTGGGRGPFGVCVCSGEGGWGARGDEAVQVWVPDAGVRGDGLHV